MTRTPAAFPAPERLSARDAVVAGRDFVELAAGHGGLFWNEYDPATGTCGIWHWREGALTRVTADGFSVRSRVYEYGGGAFCVANDAVVFVNDSDQQLYRLALDGSVPQPLTRGGHRYGGLRYGHGRILAVEEDHDTHRLVSIGVADGVRTVLAEGADFYAAPALSEDGRRIAWVEWQRPHQPWTSTVLKSMTLDDGGQGSAPRVVAGSDDEESLQQPCFDESGHLFCLTDRADFWQPWQEHADGLEPLPAAAADHASAPWQLAQQSWLPLGGGASLGSWLEDGFGVLGYRDGNGRVHRLAARYSRFRNLAVDAGHFYCVAASPDCPAAVLAIRRDDHHVEVLASVAPPLSADSCVRPQPLCYPSSGAQVNGFFYPPASGAARAPLVVFVHGGPTSACYPVFDPRIQFWTQRGFAVADLNYRGSTGYGRRYRQALHLNWGVVDVDDACAAVGHLAARGLADPDRAFIRGSSAGGYTTLCALAFRDVFRGGASLYGVSDPVALARVTHKFEADYIDWLIGDPTADHERFHDRTPVLHADRIRVPVAFFQGELDAVVVPEQTRSMVNALKANGIAVEAHYYADERHGFRKAGNQAHALQAEYAFYCRILEPPEQSANGI
ncbi:dipeptidyl aminopeptidase/acylaminoacyl peptidase [Paraburkholderia silvatlantica]|uniref:Dipeptidyl aminopeptidase/acylaminoacyl peptidase n=1 Tax=Paraburkholderia silvatlantica TaxID=321895 RepID=A0A2V4UJH1_9BURK|nr:S9 family peptidase [Paraburkholderia silvatlantica]PYE28070.1 dipeptidyl aminopeptidase/acylaminoacyl peptidase [Paraburkholderia silvatlantica]